MMAERGAVDVGGVSIAWVRAGAGAPLVLLHGGISDARYWRPQLETLSEEFTVLAWDAPGAGDSSDVPATWRLADFADALAGWLAAMDVRSAHVLGLSWGSSIVIEFERRHAGAASSLILASAYAGWAGSLEPAEVAARRASALSAADASADEMLRQWPGLLPADAPPELHEEQRVITEANTGQRHPGGYLAAIESMAEADLRDALPRIGVPTLLLYGERDERSPLHVAHALHEAIPSARLEIIPGAGHLCNIEAPAAFDACVRRFVRTVEPGR